MERDWYSAVSRKILGGSGHKSYPIRTCFNFHGRKRADPRYAGFGDAMWSLVLDGHRVHVKMLLGRRSATPQPVCVVGVDHGENLRTTAHHLATTAHHSVQEP